MREECVEYLMDGEEFASPWSARTPTMIPPKLSNEGRLDRLAPAVRPTTKVLASLPAWSDYAFSSPLLAKVQSHKSRAYPHAACSNGLILIERSLSFWNSLNFWWREEVGREQQIFVLFSIAHAGINYVEGRLGLRWTGKGSYMGFATSFSDITPVYKIEALCMEQTFCYRISRN
jgi:hypothetical protein